jgi:hypothetical protein
MRSRTRAALLGGLAIGFAGLAGARPEEKPSINWAVSWEKAVEEATARKVPLFVTFHKDN